MFLAVINIVKLRKYLNSVHNKAKWQRLARVLVLFRFGFWVLLVLYCPGLAITVVALRQQWERQGENEIERARDLRTIFYLILLCVFVLLLFSTFLSCFYSLLFCVHLPLEIWICRGPSWDSLPGVGGRGKRLTTFNNPSFFGAFLARPVRFLCAQFLAIMQITAFCLLTSLLFAALSLSLSLTLSRCLPCTHTFCLFLSLASVCHFLLLSILFYNFFLFSFFIVRLQQFPGTCRRACLAMKLSEIREWARRGMLPLYKRQFAQSTVKWQIN